MKWKWYEVTTEVLKEALEFYSKPEEDWIKDVVIEVQNPASLINSRVYLTAVPPDKMDKELAEIAKMISVIVVNPGEKFARVTLTPMNQFFGSSCLEKLFGNVYKPHERSYLNFLKQKKKLEGESFEKYLNRMWYIFCNDERVRVGIGEEDIYRPNEKFVRIRPIYYDTWVDLMKLYTETGNIKYLIPEQDIKIFKVK